jgi:hypothetical protein
MGKFCDLTYPEAEELLFISKEKINKLQLYRVWHRIHWNSIVSHLINFFAPEQFIMRLVR